MAFPLESLPKDHFQGLMDYWKDNHSDADVRQRALEIVNEYPLM